MKNLNDVVIGADGEGFELSINWADGEGFISCGEEVRDITETQAELLVNGDLSVAADLFDYSEFEAI